MMYDIVLNTSLRQYLPNTGETPLTHFRPMFHLICWFRFFAKNRKLQKSVTSKLYIHFVKTSSGQHFQHLFWSLFITLCEFQNLNFQTTPIWLNKSRGRREGRLCRISGGRYNIKKFLDLWVGNFSQKFGAVLFPTIQVDESTGIVL